MSLQWRRDGAGCGPGRRRSRTSTMRVLHYRRRFSQLSERFLYDYVVEQGRLGADARVATATRLYPDARPLEAVHLLEARASLGELARGALARLRGEREEEATRAPIRRALSELATELRPKVLHAHFGNDGFTALPVARSLGLPLVVGFYGYDISSLPLREPWRSRYRELFRDAAAFVTLSEEMRDAALALGIDAEKLEVIHIGKRLADYPFRRRQGPVRRLLSVGRLTAKKGHADTLRALAELRPRFPDVRLTVIGDGELEGELRRLAATLGIESQVHFAGPGPTQHHELISELAAADAFVLASKTAPSGDREGTPTVLLEAQALGLPCVSTLHAGIPETVSARGRALLAPEGDVAGLTGCLARLFGASDVELAELADAGLEHVQRGFELEACCRQQLALYARLASPS